MSLLELRKNFLAVLLVSFMALGMAACSSTGDSDDSASSDAESENEVDCSTRIGENAQQECELLQDNTGD